ncbi:MAG: aspartyl/asparaginyl beta-hydroxylase domain-containing protein, partial [Sphingobium sp.]
MDPMTDPNSSAPADTAADVLVIPDAMDATLKPSSKLVPKKPLIMRFGKWMQPKTNRWIANSATLGDPPVYDTAAFPWVKELESHWETIRAEAAAALQDLEKVPPLATISPDHRRIAPAGRWRSFFLIGYRYRDDANCAKCPKTIALIEKIVP